MKKFILFSFLSIFLSSSFVCFAYAQDGSDEFADPSLELTPTPQTYPTLESSTPGTSVSPSDDMSFSTPQEVPAASSAMADFNESQEPQSGDVVLEMQNDFQKSYKERRGRHGILFSLNYEKFYPTDYYSQYHDMKIEKFLGTDSIDLVGGELGYKFNFQLGSVALLGNYAQGSKKGLVESTTNERELSISRYGASLNLALDNFMQEPWVVPYGQVGIHQFQVLEDDASKFNADGTPDSRSKTTQFALNYRLGLLFQLNWIEKSIDPSTQIDGLRSSGLQNTFIDVYMISHLASSETYSPEDPDKTEGDPDLASELELGVGLKLEF